MPFSRDRQLGKVVIDTCCVINGASDPDSDSGTIISLVIGGNQLLVPCANAPLKREISHYLSVVGPTCDPDFSRILSTFRSRLRPVARPRSLKVLGLDKSLVHGCAPDLEPIASSIIAGGNPPIVTCDLRHLRGNADRILQETGIKVLTPDEWLETFAPALLCQ